MKILYRYTSTDHAEKAIWSFLGIDRCYIKRISVKADGLGITKKRHYHTDVEIHMIKAGYQIYKIGDEEIRIDKDELLLIAPNVAHTALDASSDTVKYAICFRTEDGDAPILRALTREPYIHARIPIAVWECFAVIERERRQKQPYSRVLTATRALECVLYVARDLVSDGLTEAPRENAAENDRLAIAKQYIEDNASRSVSLLEVASYCYISEKQLTRMFREEESVTVGEYIRQRRCLRIEELLTQSTLTLSEISEALGFQNEYYFNTYCKKYIGMSPGAYRRAIHKK